MRCTIVIPVYGQSALTQRCLDVLLAQQRSGTAVEIVVVDDGSQDDTPQLLAEYGDRIRVVRHETNSGFATTCNDGAAASSGDVLVFLNNDTIPQPGWLEALTDYAARTPEAGIVGAKLLFPDETIQHAGVVIDQYGYPTHIYAGFPASHPAVARSRRFQAVTAACVLVQRPLFEQLGGFDPEFRNCFEDVDFCLRAGAAGAEVHYCADSVLYHLESMSDGRFDHAAAAERLYADRWVGRVSPDDFRYYVEDGLVNVLYAHLYPLRIQVSAELGVISEGDGPADGADLVQRTRRRSIETTKEISRLNALLVGDGHQNGGGRPRVLSEGAARWLSPNPAPGLVSLVVPVKNDLERVRALLPRVIGQEGHELVEVIAVDCGSSDGTLDVLREFDATILSLGSSCMELPLPNVARHARGEVIVLLGTQATPADENWLRTLLSALGGDSAIAATCSRLLPAEAADPLTRRELLEGGLSSMAPGAITDVGAFHCLSTAFRVEVLRRIPLPTVARVATDTWAAAVLADGLTIRHEPRSLALVDAPSVLELVERGLGEGRAEHGRGELDFDRVLLEAFEQAREDWRHLERDPRLTGKELEEQQLDAAFRRLTHAAGRVIGRSGGSVSGERLWSEDAAGVVRSDLGGAA